MSESYQWMNFSPLETPPCPAMRRPKIEPVLTLKDAPPIAAIDQPAAPEAAKPDMKLQSPRSRPRRRPKRRCRGSRKSRSRARNAGPERPSCRRSSCRPARAPNLPPAPQLDPVVVPVKNPRRPRGARPATQSRSTRFALLAASVAIAASFGAIGGSLGVAKFGPMISSAPPPAAPVAKEQVADEVKALKDTVALCAPPPTS